MKKRLLTLIGALLLVAGCASVTKDIKVETDVDPKANLAGYTSYTWLGSAAILYDPEGKWEPPEFDADTEIKFLIDRELRAHGLSESMSNPDLIVAFAAGIDMAFAIVEHLHGKAVADETARYIEYPRSARTPYRAT